MGPLAEAGVNAAQLTRVGSSQFYVGGYTVPFDMSAAFLIVGGVLVLALWKEHYKQPLAAATAKPSGDADDAALAAAAQRTACCGPVSGCSPAIAWLLASPTALLLMVQARLSRATSNQGPAPVSMMLCVACALGVAISG